MSKYTPWFDAITQKPVRKGVYQVKHRTLAASEMWALWDGECWRFAKVFKDWASKEKSPSVVMIDPTRKPQWRGLTKKGAA